MRANWRCKRSLFNGSLRDVVGRRSSVRRMLGRIMLLRGIHMYVCMYVRMYVHLCMQVSCRDHGTWGLVG